MSSILTHPPVLIRAEEAERLDSIGHVLLADSSATGGALSSHRIALARGADGAVPHRHDNSSELFYILDGTLDVLVGADVVAAAPATCSSCRPDSPTPSPPTAARPPRH